MEKRDFFEIIIITLRGEMSTFYDAKVNIRNMCQIQF